jgi:serpin B
MWSWPQTTVVKIKMDSTATTDPLACRGLTALALRLLSELAETSVLGNLVFSPLSIYAALALTAAGAGGATLQEFLDVLGARSRDELAEIVRGLAEQALADRSLTGGPHVSFAFGLWHDETLKLKPAFRDAAAHSCKAETRAVNFREEVSTQYCPQNRVSLSIRSCRAMFSNRF